MPRAYLYPRLLFLKTILSEYPVSMRLIIVLLLLVHCAVVNARQVSDYGAIDSLAMRVTEGTSEGRIHFRKIASGADRDTFYVATAPDGKSVEIGGNNTVSMAVGLNRYLRDVARIHISWNNLTQSLPEELPLPADTLTGGTDMKDRYYLNYCTLSYSMPFWDFARWEKEMDWMALHGVNMCLAGIGMEPVWRSVLSQIGYDDDEIAAFIPGPGYRAWWLMNNLEGWGGPVTEQWYEDSRILQRRVVDRMRELEIEPVFPGYAGMIPHDAGSKLGIDVADPGLWCGFTRPAFLMPGDETFDRVADLYYQALDSLYGKSRYYSMDPFHEGGDVSKVDLGAAGKAIFDAMRRTNPGASWVVQAWHVNPRPEILRSVGPGGMKVLDLYADKLPQWGDSSSPRCRKEGFLGHDWLYCMLLNFGGNVGMHGRMAYMIDEFAKARSEAPSPLTGVGVTAEGIENNPVMYELLFDLPWGGVTDRDSWLKSYLTARYGRTPTEEETAAWHILATTVYDAPLDYKGEGTPESVLCARPAKNLRSVSTWGCSDIFYTPEQINEAARLLTSSASDGRNSGLEYDIIDAWRQSNATVAHELLHNIDRAFESGDTVAARKLSGRFMALIDNQDSLLSIIPDTQLSTWLDMAAQCGTDPVQRLRNVENAARLITVRGDSVAANRGGLHDYSHREWGGLLRSLYRARWEAWWQWRLSGEQGPAPDFWAMEMRWLNDTLEPYRRRLLPH